MFINQKFVKGLLIAAFFYFPALVNAQGLTLSASQLNFGVAYENAPDSLTLTISNPTAAAINVTGFRFYNIYGEPAFSAADNYLTVPAGGSATTWIRFSPRHNIFHNTEMVVVNDGLRGYLSVDLQGQGRYSNTYYNATENLSEEALKQSIHTITGNNYLSLGYTIGRDTMFMITDNKKVNGQGASVNTIECIYTGREAIGYTDRTDCQTNDNFNTEHTFPQSLFSSQEPMRSDLHHLFPTDNDANNERADNLFGIVSSPTWSVGGSRSNGTIFEPRDAQKGRTARAMLYFVLRYQNYSNYVTLSEETTLRNWHNTFLPDAVEEKRNSDIMRAQHNRNPFVDYPQFTDRIHSFISTSVAPTDFNADLTQDTIIFGYVTANTSADFNYVMVNYGNVAIDISNIQITHPSELSFTYGDTATTLQPGESHNFGIHFFSPLTDSVRAFFSFDYVSNGGGTLNHAYIPVFVNDVVHNSISENDKPALLVYPNPANEVLIVEFPGSNFHGAIELYSMIGQKVLTQEIDNVKVELNVRGLSPGIYFLKAGASAKSIEIR